MIAHPGQLLLLKGTIPYCKHQTAKVWLIVNRGNYNFSKVPGQMSNQLDGLSDIHQSQLLLTLLATNIPAYTIM